MLMKSHLLKSVVDDVKLLCFLWQLCADVTTNEDPLQIHPLALDQHPYLQHSVFAFTFTLPIIKYRTFPVGLCLCRDILRGHMSLYIYPYKNVSSQMCNTHVYVCTNTHTCVCARKHRHYTTPHPPTPILAIQPRPN